MSEKKHAEITGKVLMIGILCALAYTYYGAAGIVLVGALLLFIMK